MYSSPQRALLAQWLIGCLDVYFSMHVWAGRCADGLKLKDNCPTLCQFLSFFPPSLPSLPSGPCTDVAASIQTPQHPASSTEAVPGHSRPFPIRFVGPCPLSALCRGGEFGKPPRGRLRSSDWWPRLHHEVSLEMESKYIFKKDYDWVLKQDIKKVF